MWCPSWMPFSWKHQYEKQEVMLLRRYTSLANSNPDFRIKHPNLVKELLNKSINNKVETKKYIKDKVIKQRNYARTPKDSVVIARFNRIG